MNESADSLSQGLFRVNLQEAGQIYQAKEKVPQFLFQTHVFPLSKGLLELGHFLFYLFQDLLCIPPVKTHTGRPVLEAGPETAESRFPSVVGKWAIDATKPVPYRAAERENYERAWPPHWGEVRLADYLGE